MNKLETARQLAKQTAALEQPTEKVNPQQKKEQNLEEDTMLTLLHLMVQNSMKDTNHMNEVTIAQEKIWQKMKQMETVIAQQTAEWKRVRRILMLSFLFLIIGVIVIFLLFLLGLQTTRTIR